MPPRIDFNPHAPTGLNYWNVDVENGEYYIRCVVGDEIVKIPLDDIYKHDAEDAITIPRYHNGKWATTTNCLTYNTEFLRWTTDTATVLNDISFSPYHKPDKPNDVADGDINDVEFMDVLNS